jgi:DNA-binding HxlR family transcriptional regulator
MLGYVVLKCNWLWQAFARKNEMSQKTVKQEYCPARSVDLIGDRWSLLIVRNAFDGMTRFGDFQRSLGVARNILSDRLRKLVDADILTLQGIRRHGVSGICADR